MSDDLNNKIKQLADLLSQENLPENLAGILSLLGGQSGEKDSPPKANEPKEKQQEKHKISGPLENKEMLDKVMRFMNNANSVNDPRITLLTALKPFMNKRRQNNINNCINIIKMSRLVSILDDSDISDS
jgi:hypothetical protein